MQRRTVLVATAAAGSPARCVELRPADGDDREGGADGPATPADAGTPGTDDGGGETDGEFYETGTIEIVVDGEAVDPVDHDVQGGDHLVLEVETGGWPRRGGTLETSASSIRSTCYVTLTGRRWPAAA